MKRLIGTILGVALLATQIASASGLANDAAREPSEIRIEQQVRKTLGTLPFYNVFDSFSYRVEGGTVTLKGKVAWPTLKTDAENMVKKIEGVEKVNSQIEVLPLSPGDDGLRLALYRAIYGHPVLQTLAIRAVPPIHILVENGHVTFEGAVANPMQKAVAGMQGNTVPGVFSVTNNLLVDDEG